MLHGAPVWTTNTWSWTEFAPSANNLLRGLPPFVTQARDSAVVTSGSSKSPKVLTDGLVYENVPANNKYRYIITSSAAGGKTVLTRAFAASDNGYDLLSLRFYSQWNDTSKDRIDIDSIEVQAEDGTWSILPGSAISYEAPDSVGQNLAVLSDSDGEPLGHRIVGIRVNFGAQESLGAFYAEIEAIGVPVLSGPRFTVEHTGGDIDRAVFTVACDYAGTAATNASFHFAYGPDAASLGDYGQVATGLDSGDTATFRILGLEGDSTYAYSMIASNNMGAASDAVSGTFTTPATGLEVRINEIMASNGTTLLTADGDDSDWVELYNPNPVAVDLSGWRMTDDPSKKWSKWKELPTDTVIPAEGYLIVWGDDYGYTGWTNGEVHVDIGFSADGEAVALARAEGDIVSQFSFGPQIKDFSYGYARDYEQLADADAAAEYRVADAGDWHSITGGVGFSTTPGAFACTLYRMNVGLGDIDTAEACVADRSRWAADPVHADFQTIAFANGSGMNYTANPFPGTTSTGDTMDNFVLAADGVIYVPSPGLWTFAAGTDDGFRARISGHGVDFVGEYATGRGYTQSLFTFNFPEAGAYNVRFVMFEGGGGSACDFSVAQGFQENWTSAFKLVGDPSGPIVHAGALSSALANDVSDAMAGESRLDWRTFFDFDGTAGPDDRLELRIRYADGFVATLNGTEIARSNAPDGIPEADATATTDRPVTLALTPEAYDVPVSLLRTNGNELVVTGLRRSTTSSDFLLDVRLVRILSEDRLYYFRLPTPGEANGDDGNTEMTPPVTFSEPHGYKTQPFQLSLSCESDPTAPIYYTFDGTAPSAANGFRYTAPIAISSTTVVRAAVPDPRSILQVDSTATYLFLDDILAQDTSTPPGFPDNGAVNGQAMRYGMDPDIVNGPDRSFLLDGFTNSVRILDGFTNFVCTLSIVTDPGNFFNAQTGIYVNANNDGRAWERAIHVEQIDPVNGAANEFSTPAGVRIRGAYSRSPGYAKHSLRLFFRSEYGSGALDFPLFGDEGADRFEKVDLRCSQNYSFYQGSDSDTLIHELFSRDTQRDMGQPYKRTRYYNLFINGVYWGVYMTEERGDADYAETYLGGDDDDWDLIKTSQPGYQTTASDGDMEAFTLLRDITENEGYGGSYSNNYYRVLGKNPDGTRNPAYPVLVDATNLMDFMINVHYAVDNDSPAADNMANNMYGLRNRTGASTGFIWLRHDAEHSLGFGGGPETDSLLRGTTGYRPETFGELRAFNPAELHYKLLDNAEYRAVFADRIQKHLFGDGALTPAKATGRFRKRMAEIDSMVVCELARWGHNDWGRNTWLNRGCATSLNFISRRTPYLVQHYRNHGWFPSIDAPSASAYSGQLDSETPFVLTCGTPFYYTTDGSDPRDGNAPSATATLVTRDAAEPIALVAKNADWRFYDWGNKPADDASGNAWNSVAFDDSSWDHGNGILGVVGGNGNAVGTATHRYINHGDSGTQVITTYFRKTIGIPGGSNAATVTRLVGDILADDGYVLYLNGVEIERHHMNPGDVGYDTFANTTVGAPEQNTYYEHSIEIPVNLLRDGTNVLAVEVHQCNSGSSDLYWDCSLGTAADSVNAIVAISDRPTRVLARAYDASTGEWSALTEAVVSQEPSIPYAEPEDALRIVEIMSCTADGGGDGSEYIVITNTSPVAGVNLEGVRVTCAKHGESPKCDFTFASGEILGAGESIPCMKAEYWSGPTQKITNGKVDARLYAASGATIQTLYIDTSWWGGACDGTGASFIAKEPATNILERAQWRPSFTALPNSLRIAEVMSSTADGKGDGSEYLVVTNLDAAAAIDLADITITAAKVSEKNGVVTTNAPSLHLTITNSVAIKKGKALTLAKSGYWPLEKLTNGKLALSVTDPAGAVCQALYVDADWWDGACDGTGASFVADEFGALVTEPSQWHPLYLPPANAAAKAVVAAASTNDILRQWFAALGADADGQAALSAFTGDATQLGRCYLTGLAPENGEIELRITRIAIDPATGAVTIGGAIEVDGVGKPTTARGVVKLLRYTEPGGVPGELELTDTAFPIEAVDTHPGDCRFFQITIR
ncbi:MAG: lamin tail domain-containing protein [Kiritimatiellia bacterium]